MRIPSIRLLCVGSLCALACALSTPAQAQEADAPRFSGGGSLRQTEPSSADDRFALQARLRPAARPGAHGRFSFSARLAPAATLGTLCPSLGNNLFTDGFE